jgi:hypothetical protein
MVISTFGTIVVYLASIILLRQYFDTSYITWDFLIKVMIITMISWMPLHLVKKIVEKCDPSEEYKVRH